MNPQNLLAELGQKMNLPALVLDAQGLAKLVFDAKVEVNIEHDANANQLHLYTILGQAPATNAAPVLEKLLAGNLFGQATQGAVLAIDPLTDDILITTTLNPDKTDMVDFEKALELHVSAAEQWMEKLGDARVESAPSPVFDSTTNENFHASYLRA